MTEERYEQAVDTVLKYLVCGESQSLCGVGGLLQKVLDVACIEHPIDISRFSRGHVTEVLDSLAYNSSNADVKDSRPEHSNYFRTMLTEAMRHACVGFYGEVCVGEISCVVSAGSDLYYGRNVDADCGLGMCAERVALMQSMTKGCNSVQFVLTCDANGNIKRPCGACLEFMSQAGLWDTWIAMEDGLWIPMRKVGWYASFH